MRDRNQAHAAPAERAQRKVVAAITCGLKLSQQHLQEKNDKDDHLIFPLHARVLEEVQLLKSELRVFQCSVDMPVLNIRSCRCTLVPMAYDMTVVVCTINKTYCIHFFACFFLRTATSSHVLKSYEWFNIQVTIYDAIVMY